MKLVAVGDTHGRNIWKDIAAKEKYDKFIFIGDYFDSKEDIRVEDQISNFNDIISFKKGNPEKVILLIGNHDYHYLNGVDEVYSDYQGLSAESINEVLQPAVDIGLLQMCYRQQLDFPNKNLLFSHAGVTNTWVKKNIKEESAIDISINNLFKSNISSFRFTPGINWSNIGNDVTQSPIWVRPYSLLLDSIDGYTQIVGHTTQEQIRLDKDFIFIDTLGTSEEYLYYDGELIIKK